MAGEQLRYYHPQTRVTYDSAHFRFADLHGHTTESDGVSTPKHIVDQARRRWLSAIAVTDHNTPEGGKRAEEYAHTLGLANYVIVGSEVSSRDGHIVALNVRHKIPEGLSAEETNYRIHRVGGLSVAVHPGVNLVSGVPIEVVRRARKADSSFDAMELVNGSVIRLRNTPIKGRIDLPAIDQDKTDKFYTDYGIKNRIAGVGGSDYHGRDVGYGVTAFNGTNVLDEIRYQRTAAAVREDSNRGWLMEYIYLQLGGFRKFMRERK